MKAMRNIFLVLTCMTLFVSLFACTSTEADDFNIDETMKHLSNSVDYENKATAIINKGGAFSIIAVEDSEQMIMFLTKSLEEANAVNTELLNSLYPTWGDRYKNEYIEGLKLIIKGHKDANAQFSIEGQKKTAAYKKWFGQLRKNIR